MHSEFCNTLHYQNMVPEQARQGGTSPDMALVFPAILPVTARNQLLAITASTPYSKWPVAAKRLIWELNSNRWLKRLESVTDCTPLIPNPRLVAAGLATTDSAASMMQQAGQQELPLAISLAIPLSGALEIQHVVSRDVCMVNEGDALLLASNSTGQYVLSSAAQRPLLIMHYFLPPQA